MCIRDSNITEHGGTINTGDEVVEITRSGKEIDSYTAVSYTHLYVYKRQVEDGAEIMVESTIVPFFRIRPCSVSAVTTVSYTHLDVYKRQGTSSDLAYLWTFPM